MTEPEMRTCLHCGGPFPAFLPQHCYCSWDCQNSEKCRRAKAGRLTSPGYHQHQHPAERSGHQNRPRLPKGPLAAL